VAEPASPDKAIKAVADALLKEKKVLVTTHIKPDGDGLGCLIAVHLALAAAGIDSMMYMADERPIAPEYLFLEALGDVHTGNNPSDAGDRTLVAVDCGNAERIGNDTLIEQAPRIINIDHHGDNSRFGEINLVMSDASSTAEILFFVLKQMGVKITPEIATALYTGILVDSGRFQYASTSAVTFKVAAELITRGVDHTAIFKHVYESEPLAKARLRCRMLENVIIECAGSMAVSVLEQKDFLAVDAGPELTDGLINSLRELEDVEIAALIYSYDTGDGLEPGYRVSLRSAGERVNVQRIAKAKGGGGHVQAAGFTAPGETPAEIIQFLIEKVERELERARRRD
jgi:phosphoesterase RecJ-like protein